MFALLCLGATLRAHALDPSVRSWLEAEVHLEEGRPASALPALEAAEAGAAAPLAALQRALLGRASLTSAPETIEAFVVAVEALSAVRYDDLRALALAEPGTSPGFDRAVVNRKVYGDTAAALSLHASLLLDARGDADRAAILRARVVAQWPDSVDGRYLRKKGGVAQR